MARFRVIFANDKIVPRVISQVKNMGTRGTIKPAVCYLTRYSDKTVCTLNYSVRTLRPFKVESMENSKVKNQSYIRYTKS